MHAHDTHPAQTKSKGIIRLLRAMKLDYSLAALVGATPQFVGQYGRCSYNVELTIRKHGGTRVYGWSLWEGKYVVEAEAHCVWQPPDKEYYINVTPSQGGELYSHLFISDPEVAISFQIKKRGPPNKIYWKN